jgi:hypothetical protein
MSNGLMPNSFEINIKESNVMGDGIFSFSCRKSEKAVINTTNAPISIISLFLVVFIILACYYLRGLMKSQ